MTKKGKPKQDGSGKGKRVNKGRGGVAIRKKRGREEIQRRIANLPEKLFQPYFSSLVRRTNSLKITH